MPLTEAGIYYADTSTTMSIADITAAQATSIANALTVLQVVTAQKTTQVSTTSTSYISSGLTATITPRYATSKILILVHSAVRTDQNGVSAYHAIFRGSTSGTNIGTFGRHFFGSNTSNIVMFDIHTIDSPATTAAQTYTLGFRGDNAAQIVSSNADGNVAQMTLMEIAG